MEPFLYLLVGFIVLGGIAAAIYVFIHERKSVPLSAPPVAHNLTKKPATARHQPGAGPLSETVYYDGRRYYRRNGEYYDSDNGCLVDGILLGLLIGYATETPPAPSFPDSPRQPYVDTDDRWDRAIPATPNIEPEKSESIKTTIDEPTVTVPRMIIADESERIIPRRYDPDPEPIRSVSFTDDRDSGYSSGSSFSSSDSSDD